MADGENINLFEPLYFERDQSDALAWSEAKLMAHLGYRNARSLRKLVKTAMQAWVAVGRDTSKEFVQLDDGSYMFTRTACFMITALADRKKPQVERALAHFVGVDEMVAGRFQDDPGAMDRIVLREDLTAGTKSLAQTAKAHRVLRFDRFMDAGYRGMYNMPLAQLTDHKGLTTGQKLIDHMGRSELAANYFRVTQTEESLRANKAFGQEKAEEVAHKVGVVVRDAMIEASGTLPEDLAVHEGISTVHKGLRDTHNALKKYDRTTTKGKRMLDGVPEDSDDPPDPGYTAEPEDVDDDEL
jgi:DNA-damage-inducible protein D